MSQPPFVSVIVPVLDGARLITSCIESLVAQQYPADRFEVIVTDNGSTDQTCALVRRHPVQLLLETRVGSYAARNRGARSARGDVLAFTDADCVADRSWLHHLVRGFNNSDVACVAGEIRSAQSSTPIEEYARRRNLMSQWNTLRHNYLPYPITANCAYRTEIFRRLQGFREDMPSGGDADLAWRMQKDLGLKITFMPDAIVTHHHRTSLRDLLAQSSKYARGAMDLTCRHGLASPPLPRRLAGVAAAMVRALANVPLKLLENGRRDPTVWMEPVCDLVWRMGEVAGMLAWYRSQMPTRIRS